MDERLPRRHQADSESSVAFSIRVFWALVMRDLAVLRKRWVEFVSRTLLQPFLLLFVFTYVFPIIGQPLADQQGFAASLVAGVFAVTILVQGVQSVSLPLVQEFGHTREIEDRIMAPLPLAGVAMVKVLSGSLQCFLAGLMVFPIARWVPAQPVVWAISWPLLLAVVPLACVMAGALGLFFGTTFQPRTVPVLFGVIIVPLTFLGCVYYSWASLAPLPWLQLVVLLNPLVYLSEGLRAALTSAQALPVWAILSALALFTALFLWLGLRGFRARVLS